MAVTVETVRITDGGINRLAVRAKDGRRSAESDPAEPAAFDPERAEAQARERFAALPKPKPRPTAKKPTATKKSTTKK